MNTAGTRPSCRPLFGRTALACNPPVLFKDSINAFYYADDILLSTCAGLHRRQLNTRGITSFFAQWVNSYNGSCPSIVAGSCAWSRRHRPHCGVPLYHPARRGHSMELRCPAPAATPPDLRDPLLRGGGHREWLRAARAHGQEPLPHSPEIGIGWAPQLPLPAGRGDLDDPPSRACAAHSATPFNR